MNYFVPLQQIFDFEDSGRYTKVAFTSRMGASVGRAANLAAR
jgi:hypothetical protein